jgi:ATP-dependent DNA ligase
VVTLDGEAVVCGGDGIAVFEDLHRRGIVSEAMLYAFDLLEFGGEDLRPFPPFDRKRLLAKLVGRRSSESCSLAYRRRYIPGGL